MNRLWNELNQVLAEQNLVLEQLVSSGKEEREALRKNDLTGIMVCLGSQERLLASLATWETRRRSLQEQIACGLDVEPGMVLSGVVNQVVAQIGEEQGRVRKTVSLVKENLSRVRELNSMNRILIRQSLAYVNSMLKAVGLQNSETYGSAGQVERFEGNVALNRSI